MKLPLFQVDVFTDKLFSGNPAAVVPLEAWLDDDRLQAIAAENNLAETAFFVRRDPGARERAASATTSLVQIGSFSRRGPGERSVAPRSRRSP